MFTRRPPQRQPTGEKSLRLYVFDISYLSGKMEAYLRYKELPYERVEPGWNELASTIHRETGLMKLPVIPASIPPPLESCAKRPRRLRVGRSAMECKGIHVW